MKRLIFIIFITFLTFLTCHTSYAIDIDANSDSAVDTQYGGLGYSTWTEGNIPWCSTTSSGSAGEFTPITGVDTNGTSLHFLSDYNLSFGGTAASPSITIQYDSTNQRMTILSTGSGSAVYFEDGINTGPSSNPSATFDDNDYDGTNEGVISVNCDEDDDCDMTFQVHSGTDNTPYTIAKFDTTVGGVTTAQFGTPGTNYISIGESGNMTCVGSASMSIPTVNGNVIVDAAGEVAYDEANDQLVIYDSQGGEVSASEVAISIIQHSTLNFDPAWAYDQSPTYRSVPLFYIGDDFPSGLTLTEWRVRYINGDPTTELNANLICDSTPDFNPAAGAVVMDALDTTTGSSSADTGFDSATCANARQLYIQLDSDPTDSNVAVSLDLWYYAEED